MRKVPIIKTLHSSNAIRGGVKRSTGEMSIIKRLNELNLNKMKPMTNDEG